MAVTTIKLPDQLKERIAEVVKDSGKSVHAFMLDAIEQQTRLAELRRQFVADALAAEADALRTGLGFSAGDVHAYIAALAKGRKARRPRPKQWRR
jgi:predicted transcriptional regulator